MGTTTQVRIPDDTWNVFGITRGLDQRKAQQFVAGYLDRALWAYLRWVDGTEVPKSEEDSEDSDHLAARMAHIHPMALRDVVKDCTQFMFVARELLDRYVKFVYPDESIGGYKAAGAAFISARNHDEGFMAEGFEDVCTALNAYARSNMGPQYLRLWSHGTVDLDPCP